MTSRRSQSISFELDGTAQEVTSLDVRRFLYWPEAMSIDSHSFVVEAVDAAGNNFRCYRTDV